MGDDDEHKPHHATARPPPGEEDVYSASTVVGEASDEILAIIRGETAAKIPGAPGLPKNLKVDPKSESKIEVPRPAAGASPAQVIKTPVAEPVQLPSPNGAVTAPPPALAPAPGSTAPNAEAEAPLAPVLAPAPSASPAPPVVTSPPPAPADLASIADDKPNFKKGTLHPAVGIVLFFIAVVVVLAALIR